MSVTGVAPTSREPLFAQVTRLANSDTLRGSESLCRLLRFLAEQALAHPGSSVKEYQIATEVFGRAADFDPRLDSTVRVQTSRLRSKLSEYYAHDGAGDSLIIEIPKGAYSLSVHLRPEPNATPAAVEAEPLEPVQKAPEPNRIQPNVLIWALGFVCLGLAVGLGFALFHRTAASPAAAAVNDAPPALRNFWHGFIDRSEQPWIIYSNAEFVGRPETGMHYFDPAKDDRAAILDHYTGVGEVIAIHELDRLFEKFHHGLLVKRGRLLSMDDAKNNDLVFVGSPSENLTLRDMPAAQHFAFRTATSGPRKGDLGIVNLHPKPDEAHEFYGTHGLPLQEDYALIGIIPGLTPTHWVMLLAGTTTIGTQAAVEYVCRSQNVETLLRKVGQSAAGDTQPFEAILRVRVSRGVPVSSEIVALHTSTGE